MPGERSGPDQPGVRPSSLSDTMVTSSKQRHWKSYLTIFSQNCLGLKTEARRTELLDVLEQRRAFAVCLQETWRPGSEDVIVGSWRCLGIGPELQQGRGTKGVAIYLSRTASRAYDAAGCQCYHEGLRNIAVRLMANTAGGGRRSIARGVFLLNSYAPTSGHSDQEWDDYYCDLSTVLGHMQNGDLLVWCTDGNASIGRSTGGDTRGAAVGPYGLDHINASGRRLRTFLELHELYAMTTHFNKKAYGTWWHPASRKPHQIDHIITTARDRKCFVDAGSRPGQLIGSDHKPVACKLRLVVRAANRSTGGSSTQSSISAYFGILRRRRLHLRMVWLLASLLLRAVMPMLWLGLLLTSLLCLSLVLLLMMLLVGLLLLARLQFVRGSKRSWLQVCSRRHGCPQTTSSMLTKRPPTWRALVANSARPCATCCGFRSRRSNSLHGSSRHLTCSASTTRRSPRLSRTQRWSSFRSGSGLRRAGSS